MTDMINLAKTTLTNEIYELQNAVLRLENDSEYKQEFLKMLDILYSCKGKIILIGVGKSAHIGKKIAASLASTGSASFFIHATELMHGDFGMIEKDDVCFIISYSGKSDEILCVLSHLKKISSKIVSLSSQNSPLARFSECNLDISIKHEAYEKVAAPTSSTTLTLALGDALVACLMEKKGFSERDFARFHPGGSLGKKLFVKVSDLARTSNMPILDKSSTLKDAIYTISKGGLGCAVFLEDKKVVGYLSDGDIRRILEQNNFNLDNLAFDFASKKIKTINKNELASDALNIINNYKISVLIVLDDNDDFYGALHIYDLRGF